MWQSAVMQRFGKMPGAAGACSWPGLATVGLLLAGGLLADGVQARAVDEAALYTHAAGLWQIAAKGSLTRWIEIHNLDEAKQSGVFHIEVLGRARDKARGPVEHVRSHMAITPAALARSVLKPLKTGSVYPESFNSAHARWLALPASARDVCDRTVIACLGP
jgi:hypothetical protein